MPSTSSAYGTAPQTHSWSGSPASFGARPMLGLQAWIAAGTSGTVQTTNWRSVSSWTRCGLVPGATTTDRPGRNAAMTSRVAASVRQITSPGQTIDRSTRPSRSRRRRVDPVSRTSARRVPGSSPRLHQRQERVVQPGGAGLGHDLGERALGGQLPLATTPTRSTICSTSPMMCGRQTTSRPAAAWAGSTPARRATGDVEAVGGLVQQQHLRLVDQRPRDTTGASCRWTGPRTACRRTRRRPSARAASRRCSRPRTRPDAGEQPHDLPRGEALGQAGLGRDVGHALAGPERLLAPVHPVDEDLAFVRLHQAGDHPQGGGLARAVRPEQAVDSHRRAPGTTGGPPRPRRLARRCGTAWSSRARRASTGRYRTRRGAVQHNSI